MGTNGKLNTPPPLGAGTLAEWIRIRKPCLIDAWVERLKREIAPAKTLGRQALVGVVPDLLGQVADSLDRTEPSRMADVETGAREHGALRVGLGFSLCDVATEFTYLNEILVGMGANGGAVEAALIQSLQRLQQVALTGAIEGYLTEERGRTAATAPPSAELVETYFRDLIDASPVILWITDEDSKCTFLSRRWYEYTGRTPQQDLGVGWLENIHPEDREETARVYTAAVSDRGPLRMDYRLRSKDGTYRWFVDQGSPRSDGAGRFLGYIGTVTDIEDRVAIARRLQESQERFDRSTRATDLGIWYCDLPFDKLIWNEEVKNHFFLAANAEVDIELFFDRIHPDDRERTRLAIQHSNDHHAPYDIVYRTTDPRAPGRTKSIRALGWTDYDAEDKPIRFDGITLDVTAQIEIQRQLEDATRNAERANEAKSAFLANMSHEIRTPIGAIMGFSDLARQPGTPPEEIRSYLEIVQRNSNQVLRIVDDILDLAKIEAGRVDLERVEFSLFTLLADFSSLMGFRAREKGIALKMVADSGLPDPILSDPTRLRQVLTNAVGNAVKFTTKGSVTLHVSAEGTRLKFAVVDTGCGISAEQAASLFQAFVQADVSTTRKFGGTGLGLVLTRRLCRLMGGDFVLEKSALGEGSTFVATIAIAVPERAQMVPRENVAFRSDTERSAPSPRRRLSGINILLVEDSLDNQQLITLILERQGANVEVAPDGRDGVKRALEKEFDVVLMDIQMPVMDGHEAVRKLRALDYGRPVVALTAHAIREEIERAEASGFTDILTKPVHRDALLEMIAGFAANR